jgi:hypothetical protein
MLPPNYGGGSIGMCLDIGLIAFSIDNIFRDEIYTPIYPDCCQIYYMPSKAAKESRKRYLAKLKVDDPERYKRYKAKGKYRNKIPGEIIVHDPIVVRTNHLKRVHKSNKNRLARIKKYLGFIKSKLKCSTCSEFDECCLEFHHFNGDDKLGDISEILHNGSIKRVTEEILKCVPLCSNCHKKVHVGRIILDNNLILSGNVINGLQNEFLEKYHPEYKKYLDYQVNSIV